MKFIKNISPVAYALLCILAWSFIPVVARLGQNEMSSLQFLFWTNAFSALALFLTIPFKKYNLKKLITNTNISFSILLGFLGGFFYYLCLYFGYARTNSVEVLLIQYTWPALVSLLAVFLLHEKLTLKKIFAVVLGAFSAILVITKGNFFSFHFNNLQVLAVVFAGAIAFALFSVLSKKEFRLNISFSVFLYFFWATLFSAFAIFLWEDPQQIFSFASWSPSTLVSVLVNGIFINGLSYILWIWALEKSQATKIAPLVYLAPLLSIFWLVSFFGETFLTVYFFALVFSAISGLLSIE